ncbi:Pentatricopeptide repeat [Dillenia turbinata]|uniref:Pentatricopeptide repeat n=1 Tax=Dillenia turbinata TaxID=194707 RepID=A0AAN8ZCH0_9MAGN
MLSTCETPRKQYINLQKRETSRQEASRPSEIKFSNLKSVTHLLKFCAKERNAVLGACVHSKIVKGALGANVVFANSMLDVYAKAGKLEEASKLFEQMPERTIVSWTIMLSLYCKTHEPDKAIWLFQEMVKIVQPNEFALAILLQVCIQKIDYKLVKTIHSYMIRHGFDRDRFLQNSLIDAYSKSGLVDAAEKVFLGLSCRDVVSWTSVISGCVANMMGERALALFIRMQDDMVAPNEVTMLSILRACSLVGRRHIFRWIHGMILKTEWQNNTLVINSVAEMYLVNGWFLEGFRLFCGSCFTSEFLYLNPETIATLLQQSCHCGYLNLAKELHGYLIKHRYFTCTIIENSLMDVYGQNKEVNIACRLFNQMNCTDTVSWNTMITCLVKNGQPYEALTLSAELHSSGIEPDFVTMMESIQACSDLASLQLGQVAHGYIIRAGLVIDVFLGNSLINMYGKTGRIDLAKKVFEEMPHRDLGSWNSIIAAYGSNGNGTLAVQMFMELIKLATPKPNAITCVNVLSACAHRGLVKEGFQIFDRMRRREHIVEPQMEHYACMVDLLARSGRVEEAQAFIEEMPLTPSTDIWITLLGACGVSRKVEIAERIADKLSVIDPAGSWRVAMANIYARVGRWEDAVVVRAKMRGFERQKKDAGWSCVEVRGKQFKFLVGDTRHSDSEMIYKVLNTMNEHCRDLALDGLMET